MAANATPDELQVGMRMNNEYLHEAAEDQAVWSNTRATRRNPANVLPGRRTRAHITFDRCFAMALIKPTEEIRDHEVIPA
jgi:hypothetical protein